MLVQNNEWYVVSIKKNANSDCIVIYLHLHTIYSVYGILGMKMNGQNIE